MYVSNLIQLLAQIKYDNFMLNKLALEMIGAEKRVDINYYGF